MILLEEIYVKMELTRSMNKGLQCAWSIFIDPGSHVGRITRWKPGIWIVAQAH
jgi:hypothetical protein